jgi:hypothetical protein
VRLARFVPPSECDVRRGVALTAPALLTYCLWSAVKSPLRCHDAVEDRRQQHQIDERRIELRASTGSNDIRG